MRKIIAVESISLDGVMQAPGRPDEDTRDGFEHGGWAQPYNDAVMGRKMGESMGSTGAIMLGRRTYEDMYGFWPKQTDGNPFTEVLNNTPKYVASTTLSDPLPWVNSVLISGDVATSVSDLKQQGGGDIAVLGSGELVRTLAQHGLVDEYLLLIHPLVLGHGRQLFSDGGSLAKLGLVDSVTTTTGVIIATYRPANGGDS